MQWGAETSPKSNASLPSCVTFSLSLYLSELEYANTWNGDNNSSCTGLQCRWAMRNAKDSIMVLGTQMVSISSDSLSFLPSAQGKETKLILPLESGRLYPLTLIQWRQRSLQQVTFPLWALVSSYTYNRSFVLQLLDVSIYLALCSHSKMKEKTHKERTGKKGQVMPYVVELGVKNIWQQEIFPEDTGLRPW